MSRPLCAGRDPEMWTPDSDNARLAIAICRRCTGCPDNDPKPHGVIRQGIAYTDAGAVLPLCQCGYPQQDRRAVETTLCRRCAAPGADRWRADITRWAARGDGYTAMGRRLGFHRKTIREALERWAREEANSAPTGAPIERKAA